MTRIAPIAGALFAAAMLIALLITAAPATASPPGASVVLDQPDGFTDPLTGTGAHSVYVRRLDDGTTTAMGRGQAAGLSADRSCLMMATDSAALVRSSPDHERVLLRAVRDRCELPEPPVGTPPGPPQLGPTGPVAQGGGPQLSALSLTRRRFRVGKSRGAKTAAIRRGAVVRFRLDRRAAVSLAIRQRVGRRTFARGTLRRTGRAGRNRVAFSGRMARRTLRPGRYVMVARARDASRTSAPRRVTFRIMPAGR